MREPRPSLSGLDEEQRQLVTAWCALYAVTVLLIAQRQAILDANGFQVTRAVQVIDTELSPMYDTMHTLRDKMTGAAAKACTLWERKFWEARNG
jgi:hypothetical protein